MTRQGIFIVLEGGEGAGKGSAITHIKEQFADRADIRYTREPGGTPIGERIRSLLLDHSSSNMSFETELLLFLAARAQNMHESIRPALESGMHVIADRFGLSTIAYQIYRKERQSHRAFLDTISATVLGDTPVHYILLDVEPSVGLARVRGRAGETTRIDEESIAVHERVRNGYLEAVREFPHTIIDANRPMHEVHQEVVGHVTRLLAKTP